MDPFAADSETETMKNIAAYLAEPTLELWAKVREMICNRCWMFESGRSAAPQWVNRRLREIDPLLALRWDFIEKCWLVERYSRRDRAWITVLEWKRQLDSFLFHTLREADTWRFGSIERYLAWKRRRSSEIRKVNQQKADDAILEAVDNLSSRQIDDFIATEQALACGDPVRFGGASLKTMERMHEAALREAASGTPPIPPDIPVLKPRDIKRRT